MTKQSGLGDFLFVGQYDLSGDTGNVGKIGAPRGLLDVTGINKSAHERVYGVRDGEISFSTFKNDTLLLGEHIALSGLPTADVICSYWTGVALASHAASLIAKQINYDWTRPTDGSLTGVTQMLANTYGLEWGNSLTAGKRTDTTATSPANGIDNDAGSVSTAFGLAAYLHVFSFTGTSATMTIQDSADNSTGWAAITGLSAFTAATTPTSQRIETDTLARTVRRYLRVITTGTFSECTFAVNVIRYLAANREY